MIGACIVSERVISLPEIAINILKEYKIWQNEEKLKCGDLWYKDCEKNKRLFVQWNGKPIFPDTISKWFGAFREKYNLPDLHFHGLRHPYVKLKTKNNLSSFLYLRFQNGGSVHQRSFLTDHIRCGENRTAQRTGVR